MSMSVPARRRGVRGRAASITVALALVFTAITSLGAQAPAAAPAAQAPLPAGMTRGATVEGITEYTLANGLRVLLFPDQSKPTVTVNITYLVGSRHEGYGETGSTRTSRRNSLSTGPSRTGPPGTTAPTTSRRRPRPTSTSIGRSTSRPTGW
jgi:hypothetical protein